MSDDDARPGMSATGRYVIAALVTAVVVSLLAMASNAEPIGFEIDSSPRNAGGGAVADAFTGELGQSDGPIDEAAPPPSERGEVPEWFLWLVGIALLVALLWFLRQQRFSIHTRRRKLPTHEHGAVGSDAAHARAVAELADDLIGDLELGADPRQAILRAYANVETGFGRRDLARRAAETPLRYLDRVFGRKRAAAPALRTLTGLFEVARFSDEPVTEAMRSDAVEALREIRRAYTAGFRTAQTAAN